MIDYFPGSDNVGVHFTFFKGSDNVEVQFSFLENDEIVDAAVTHSTISKGMLNVSLVLVMHLLLRSCPDLSFHTNICLIKSDVLY